MFPGRLVMSFDKGVEPDKAVGLVCYIHDDRSVSVLTDFEIPREIAEKLPIAGIGTVDHRDPSIIRPDIREKLDAYAERHEPVGQFLQACLSNDLNDACGRADSDNIHTIPAIICYIYNDMPRDCWGSRGQVKKWLAERE